MNRAQRRARGQSSPGPATAAAVPSPRPVQPSTPAPSPVPPVAGQLELDADPAAVRAEALADVARRVRRVADARRELARAVVAAAHLGVSYADLGRVLGVSRQAVRQQVLAADA